MRRELQVVPNKNKRLGLRLFKPLPAPAATVVVVVNDATVSSGQGEKSRRNPREFRCCRSPHMGNILGCDCNADFYGHSDRRDTLERRQRQGHRILHAMKGTKTGTKTSQLERELKKKTTVRLKRKGSPTIFLGGPPMSIEYELLRKYRIVRSLGAGTYSQVFLAIPEGGISGQKGKEESPPSFLPLERDHRIVQDIDDDVSKRGDKDIKNEHHPAFRVQRRVTSRPLGKYEALPPVESVAIKIIPRNAASSEYEKQMREEASLLNSFGTHPNVVRLYEFCVSERNFFMVMEAAPLTLVDTLVRLHEDTTTDFQISERNVCPLFRQILLGLAFLHERGYAHLDVKPDNLAIGADGHVKLLDFGLAMRVPGFRPCHTMLFCPPEILREKRAYAVSDVWASGVLLFLLITGYFPFNAYNDEDARRLETRILSGLPEDVLLEASMSDVCKSFVRQLLVLSPEKRVSAREALGHRWFKEPAAKANRNVAALRKFRTIARAHDIAVSWARKVRRKAIERKAAAK